VGSGEDCSASQCCKLQGAQCFRKNKYWAACQATCVRDGKWSCEALGKRAPQITQCTWAGEDCSLTKLCCNINTKCIRQNAQAALCTTQAPAGWNGAVLGGAVGEHVVAAAGAGPIAGASLFCFMAVLPGSAEEGLRQAAEGKQGSIYACEAHAVYPSEPAGMANQGTWNSFVNTDAFVKVWLRVRADRVYLSHDWTVKVDPDTVFFPDRFRAHLGQLRPPVGASVYIKNCNVGFGFMGAIEALSRKATHDLLASIGECHRTMGGHSGEDGFLKECLDMVGAGYMTDANVLGTPHDTSNCADGGRVAFHPRKDAGSWLGCFGTAAR